MFTNILMTMMTTLMVPRLLRMREMMMTMIMTTTRLVKIAHCNAPTMMMTMTISSPPPSPLSAYGQ